MKYKSIWLNKSVKLTKHQQLKIKLAKISVKILWLNLWQNTLYEFHGYIQAWIKSTKRLFSENAVVTREDMSRLTYYIYGDFSAFKPNPNRHFLLLQIYAFFYVMQIDRIVKLFPLDIRIQSLQYTGRHEYHFDRARYRAAHRVARLGYDLKAHYYEEYKYIADKYNWPIIYNSTEEDYN